MMWYFQVLVYLFGINGFMLTWQRIADVRLYIIKQERRVMRRLFDGHICERSFYMWVNVLRQRDKSTHGVDICDSSSSKINLPEYI